MFIANSYIYRDIDGSACVGVFRFLYSYISSMRASVLCYPFGVPTCLCVTVLDSNLARVHMRSNAF